MSKWELFVDTLNVFGQIDIILRESIAAMSRKGDVHLIWKFFAKEFSNMPTLL